MTQICSFGASAISQKIIHHLHEPELNQQIALLPIYSPHFPKHHAREKLKQFSFLQAVKQGWDLLQALRLLWPGSQPRRASCRFVEPEDVGCLKSAREAAPVIVGTALNLLICITELEIGGRHAADLEELAESSGLVNAWLE